MIPSFPSEDTRIIIVQIWSEALITFLCRIANRRENSSGSGTEIVYTLGSDYRQRVRTSPLIPTHHSGKRGAFPAVMNSGSESTYRVRTGRSEIMISEENWRKKR